MEFPADEVIMGQKVLYDRHFKHGYDIVLGCNDVLEFLQEAPEAKLVVTSPPYNIGKPYEDRVEFRDYLAWQKEVLKRCIEILSPQGSLCWEVGNYIENGEVFPLDIYFYDIIKKELGLHLRNRIVWHFGHGLHASKRFSGRYETILWFTKTDDYTFNLDAVRVPQKYPGKRSYKGPNKGKPSAHPLGKNPSDKWQPSQFPIELVERLVLALTNEGDTVFDPFMGVGSALIAALLHNRKAVGVDKEKQYTDIAFERVSKALRGNLRKRRLGKPVWKPKGTEKVVRKPDDWDSVKLFNGLGIKQ